MTQTNNQTNQNVLVEYDCDGQKVKLSPQIIKDYLTNGQAITMPEFKMFTELCKAKKLNPFLKQAYIIKFGNSPASIVVSKDVFLQRANNNQSYDGKENGVITRNKESGTITERNGAFCPIDEEIVGGWCKVYRKDRKYAEYVSVSIEECAKKKSNGELNTNWTSQKGTMIEKVAISRALRNAFPDEFSGMYIEEEMPANKEEQPQGVQEDPMESKKVDAEIIDVTPNAKEVDINSL